MMYAHSGGERLDLKLEDLQRATRVGRKKDDHSAELMWEGGEKVQHLRNKIFLE